MNKAIFYHAGCPVCVSAEESIVDALDKQKYDVEIIHLGEKKEKLSEAESAGITSVPALIINGNVFHINHGADLSALR